MNCQFLVDQIEPEQRMGRYMAAYALALIFFGLRDRPEALHGDPRFEAQAEKTVTTREFHASSK